MMNGQKKHQNIAAMSKTASTEFSKFTERVLEKSKSPSRGLSPVQWKVLLKTLYSNDRASLNSK